MFLFFNFSEKENIKFNKQALNILTQKVPKCAWLATRWPPFRMSKKTYNPFQTKKSEPK